VPINPLYARAMEGKSGSFERNDPVKFEQIGDSVKGFVVNVGEPFQKAKPEAWLKEDTPEWAKTQLTQVIVLDTNDGKRDLWLNNTAMFAAVGAALVEAELHDVEVGDALMFKWANVKSNPKGGALLKVWECKIVRQDKKPPFGE
jgi:hypothetical protein